jgi:predicted nucleic acid-binding protein
MTPTLLVDTHILIDVLQEDPRWAEWSVQQMSSLSRTHRLCINWVIYAELSSSFDSMGDLDALLAGGQLPVEAPERNALFVAGRAHALYRKRGGTRTQVLGDFIIGAQAATQGWTLLTRDATRFRTYFPTLRVIAPAS